MTLGNIIGKRTKELLYENKMSIYRLSKITCLHEKTLSDLINGRSNDAKISTVYLIANAFNMDILEFLKPDEFRNKNIDI